MTADIMAGSYGELYKLVEEAEQGVSKEDGDAMKTSFASDTFAIDQLLVYMRQVKQPTLRAAQSRFFVLFIKK
jgi:hypothetical protein